MYFFGLIIYISFSRYTYTGTLQRGFPDGTSGKESPCQVQETWVWFLSLEDTLRKKWQPTPVFLLEEYHGQRSLLGSSPWGRKRVGQEWASKHTHTPYKLNCLANPIKSYFKTIYNGPFFPPWSESPYFYWDYYKNFLACLLFFTLDDRQACPAPPNPITHYFNDNSKRDHFKH